MRILAISDLHGDLDSAWAAVETVRPDLLVCCGDWGDPGDVELPDLVPFSARLPVYTVYGNHDHLGALRAWRNRDGSPVLLANGEVRTVGEVTLAGISGIWATTHRKPYYITDAEVDEAALRLAGERVDILMTHGCPLGVADVTLRGSHGGQRCFLRAFQLINPRVYLTGHLHRAQEYRTRGGQIVRNVGVTPDGEATLVTVSEGCVSVQALAGGHCS